MAELKKIVLHCSDTLEGDVNSFRKYHMETLGWRDVGYNGVVLNGYAGMGGYRPIVDGYFEIGRGFDLDSVIDSKEQGAHAFGYNGESLGFCLVGKKHFTIKQFQTILHLCKFFKSAHPGIDTLGHCELTDKKTCPNFDMKAFRQLLMGNDFSDVAVVTFMQPSVVCW